ncbi:uncharacterized protein LOC124184190 [Neodiprion fabricii]|uniref:uncharacterized protein LOC124184190 n=1 Tax=Neodiprion fabricii TaxID=2872261 RepID=UPI001ED8CC09|nr:uncharacterized protein LOC124184190 [Neodiprion fabricii]
MFHENGKTSIKRGNKIIATGQQLADAFTKPLPSVQFSKIWKRMSLEELFESAREVLLGNSHLDPGVRRNKQLSILKESTGRRPTNRYIIPRSDHLIIVNEN